MSNKIVTVNGLQRYTVNINNVIDAKIQDINIPTHVSELENDSNFITFDAAQQMI